MRLDEITTLAQAITTGGAIVVLVWVIRNLIGKNGDLAARWSHDLEHTGRLDAEKRADRVLDLYEASVEKRRGRA